ncbi:MAG: penicillin-binding protein 2, partial [Planctomycetes bacterium]|nr:penicillin-binding protein 2 [Planctomycetota bacterium]
MNPQNGEVYALANWPTFDPARARETDAHIRRNRALTDPVEPGSLFKPFTIASALEGGYVTLDETIDCLNGPFRGKGIGVIREYKNYFGSLSVAQVIVRSSNIGAAKIALKMPKPYFYGMIRKFGFGQKTGIDLNGEGAGILRPLREWKWGQYAVTRAAFGQGPVSVTGIQLIRGFSCLANGGRMIKPKVVKGILDAGDYHVVKDFGKPSGDSEVSGEGDRIISEKIAREFIRRSLTAVVDRKQGTAHNAYLEEYRVFGKTGTAQVVQNGVYQNGKYVSSFIGAAPEGNPSICVLIMVHQPDRSLGLGYTGGAVAAKPVGEIIRESLAYLNVPRSPLEESGAGRFQLAKAVVLLNQGSIAEGRAELQSIIDDGGPAKFIACVLMADLLSYRG